MSEAYKGPQTNNVAELLAIIKALSILTASDNIRTGKISSSLEREQSFMDMVKIALAI